MKSKIRSTVVTLVVTASLFISSTSHALVALMTSSRVSAITGGVITGIGGAGLGVAAISLKTTLGGAAAGIFMFGIPGAILAAIGVIVLDDPNQPLRYKEISVEEAQKLGFSKNDLYKIDAYNTELNVTINPLMNDISSQSKTIVDQLATQGASEDMQANAILQHSTEFWQQNKELLSPEASEVLLKVTQNLQAQLKKQINNEAGLENYCTFHFSNDFVKLLCESRRREHTGRRFTHLDCFRKRKSWNRRQG